MVTFFFNVCPLLINISKLANHPSWIASHNRIGWHVFGHDRASTHRCTLPNAHRQDSSSTPYSHIVFHDGGQFDERCCDTRVQVISKHNAMPNEYPVPNLDTITDKSVRANLGELTNGHSSLDFNKRANGAKRPNATAVDVAEVGMVNDDFFSYRAIFYHASSPKVRKQL
jgi:hypothetical protein